MWVFNYVKIFISPIYDDLVELVKAVKDENLTGDEKKAKVLVEIKDILAKKNFVYSDSMLNIAVEIVYQLVKNNKE
jgi:hypothetical protein